MNIYVVADLEGVAGVAHWDDLSHGEARPRACERLTLEVQAVCEGLFAGGADRVVVNDFHGGGRNLAIEKLPREIELICGRHRPGPGIECLDETFEAIMFVGAHAQWDAPEAVMAHTLRPGLDVRINGRRFGEIGLLAGIAGERGTVAALVSGDEAACREAADLVPGIRQVVSKYGLRGAAARSLHPELVFERLRDAAGEALEGLTEIRPFWVQKPVQLEAEVSTVEWADLCSWIPGLQRSGTRRLTFEGRDLPEVYGVLHGIASLQP